MNWNKKEYRRKIFALLHNTIDTIGLSTKDFLIQWRLLLTNSRPIDYDFRNSGSKTTHKVPTKSLKIRSTTAFKCNQS